MENTIMTVDGNGATAHVAYEFTEIAAIYPITPSSPMATKTDQWAANKRKNMFGQHVTLVEMQSEAGACGAIHGSLQAGALSTTFTSSQGLMLMIPTIYRIAGEHLPAVFHVAARTVGTHAMSIFGDHSDVMACRQTGVGMICSGSVQETADLAAVAHLAAIKCHLPMMHFFDGFRTSHEISRIDMADVSEYSKLVDQDALESFKKHALNPEHPILRNTVQNDDVYFQIREGNNLDYKKLGEAISEYMGEVSKICGREYKPYQYYGASDATEVIVAMGSVSGAIKEVVDALNESGRKVGFVQVHMYRPFFEDMFLAEIPESVKRIAVLDRCKEMGSAGEPLFGDVCIAFNSSDRNSMIIGGRYGLSSKDTDPAQIAAVFDNLIADKPIRSFTIGINDDVTHLSLETKELDFNVGNKDMIACKFWGLGGDGTVGANHNTAKILGDFANMYSQAYFEYDAKKSFGITKSHLKFSKEPIRGSYYVKKGDIVACHNQSFMKQYDIVSEIKKGGKLLLNCTWSEEELSTEIPAKVRRQIAEKNIRLYTVNATAIAQELGLGSHTNTVLQAAFFKISELMPVDVAIAKMQKAAEKAYFTKGSSVVKKNVDAISLGADNVVEITIPADWVNAEGEMPSNRDGSEPAVVRNILDPVNKCKGNELPVSAFMDRLDGATEVSLTSYEKRGIAANIPVWDATACVQCNKCSFVCPHAVIRPYLLNDEEIANAPEGFETVKAKINPEYNFAISISTYDCTGCGSCVSNCPMKDSALKMVPADLKEEQKTLWNYGLSLSKKEGAYDKYTFRGSQFEQPLVEFSAACAGCGETPYAKLLTQLFGERVYWANGTGCSQAWGAPFPGIPYTVSKRGFGPAWTNSLFENNAELMLGVFLSAKQQRAAEKKRVEKLLSVTTDETLMETCNYYLSKFHDFEGSRVASDELLSVLESQSPETPEEQKLINSIVKHKDQLAKKTFWMYGGDGWAYDIGFGGLDHVIASGANINTFIVDTEVYSNTGGQSSKATPIGAVAQFASAGKKTRKKDLGAIFMTYGNVYVAQVAMGANPAQLVKVLKEAEEYDGPSVIIAYTPCQAHGIKSGMANVQQEMKRAVDSGYWTLYHYDPRLEKPLVVDSKMPVMDYEEFLDGETRYASLRKTFPENAEKLFKQASEDAKKRYEKYKNMEKSGN